MKEVPGFSNYYVSEDGVVYHSDKTPIKPFKSNKYLQVYMRGDDNKRHIYGVHQVVAMTFKDDYYDGCVVHHVDEDTTNNNVENLEIQSRTEHGKHHANADPIIKYIKKNGPANKGKKMSPEFCEHCRQAALKRCAKKRTG